jgi:formylglycine-generating enzyme
MLHRGYETDCPRPYKYQYFASVIDRLSAREYNLFGPSVLLGLLLAVLSGRAGFADYGFRESRRRKEVMRKMFAVAAATALLSLCGAVQAVVSIETVTIGNPGNAADSYSHSGNPAGQGAVSYTYNIGKYEVTAGQYTAFLNAVARTDTYGLYNTSMWSNSYGCKIQRGGSSGSYTYSVASDYANRPVNYVSYWDSCRFANWLGTGSTETGAYTLTPTGIANNTITRNAGWKYAVTSEDEWYKAAYYRGGGLYSLYANGTSATPVAGTASNYDTVIAHTWDGRVNGALEQNGTKDMMGNVWEWNEAIGMYYSSYRGLRGGSWGGYDSLVSLQASYRWSYDPSSELNVFGFRVSQSVPEPSSIIALLGGVGGLGGMMWRRRR